MLRPLTSATSPYKNQAAAINNNKPSAARFAGYRIPDHKLDLSTQTDSVVLKNGKEISRDQVVKAMKSLKALDEDQSLKDRDFVFEHLDAFAKSELQGKSYEVPSEVLKVFEKHSIVENGKLSKAMAAVIGASVRKEDARIELNTPIILYRLNLSDKLSSMNQDWADQIVNTGKQQGVKIPLTGEDFNSLPNTLNEDYEVHLAGRSVIKKHLPWLHDLYTGDLKELASKIFSRPLHNIAEGVSSKDSSLVINYTPPGKAYENHTDSNTVSAVLYTKDMEPGQGGLIVHPEGKKFVLSPKKGDIFIFDGRHLPHEVEPASEGRTSVPMDFYADAKKQWRHPDTDKHVINGEKDNK